MSRQGSSLLCVTHDAQEEAGEDYLYSECETQYPGTYNADCLHRIQRAKSLIPPNCQSPHGDPQSHERKNDSEQQPNFKGNVPEQTIEIPVGWQQPLSHAQYFCEYRKRNNLKPDQYGSGPKQHRINIKLDIANPHWPAQQSEEDDGPQQHEETSGHKEEESWTV